jgi:hypothetical protein
MVASNVRNMVSPFTSEAAERSPSGKFAAKNSMRRANQTRAGRLPQLSRDYTQCAGLGTKEGTNRYRRDPDEARSHVLIATIGFVCRPTKTVAKAV